MKKAKNPAFDTYKLLDYIVLYVNDAKKSASYTYNLLCSIVFYVNDANKPAYYMYNSPLFPDFECEYYHCFINVARIRKYVTQFAAIHLAIPLITICSSPAWRERRVPWGVGPARRGDWLIHPVAQNVNNILSITLKGTLRIRSVPFLGRIYYGLTFMAFKCMVG